MKGKFNTKREFGRRYFIKRRRLIPSGPNPGSWEGAGHLRSTAASSMLTIQLGNLATCTRSLQIQHRGELPIEDLGETLTTSSGSSGPFSARRMDSNQWVNVKVCAGRVCGWASEDANAQPRARPAFNSRLRGNSDTFWRLIRKSIFKEIQTLYLNL